MVTFGSPFGGALSTRVSSALSRNVVLANLMRAQRTMLRLQDELSSGYRILQPSDDPAGASRVLDYTRGLRRDRQFLRNLEATQAKLGHSEIALGAASDILIRSKNIFLEQRQPPADAATRSQAGGEMKNLLDNALRQANSRFQDRYLFGGSRTTQAPFAFVGGEVAFLGDLDLLRAEVSDGQRVSGNVGADGFGAFSAEIRGLDSATFLPIDLDPALTATTRLSDLHGGGGVALGSLSITGVGTASIDLRAAKTVGDVLDLINGQAGLTGVTASINPAANGLRLSAGGAITVAEVLNGATAADLGIATTVAAPPFDGADLDPRLTQDARLGDLLGGLGIDASGLVLANATATQTHQAVIGGAAVAAGASVEQLLNAINTSAAYVHAEISEDGTRIDLFSRLSGGRLTVSENGGTTAAELGLESTLERANLRDLNGGAGVGSADGADLRITKMDGSQVLFDVDGAATLHDLVAAIDADADLAASVTASGEIEITDSSAAAGTLRIESVSPSQAAEGLGIRGEVTGAGPQTFTGTALTFVGAQVEGLFTSLIRLRDALLADDVGAMDAAAGMNDRAADKLLDARADLGARMAGLDVARDRLEQEEVALETLRASTREADLAETATRFQIQQTVLEAALAAAARVLDTHLLKFI